MYDKQFENVLKGIKYQDSLNELNRIFPENSCGNKECQDECIRLLRIAKNLSLDPVAFIEQKIREEIASSSGCVKYAEAFSYTPYPNYGKPIPGCRFGYTYGSHPDATDDQLEAGTKGRTNPSSGRQSSPEKENAANIRQDVETEEIISDHEQEEPVIPGELYAQNPSATQKQAGSIPAGAITEAQFNKVRDGAPKREYTKNDGTIATIEDTIAQPYSNIAFFLYDKIKENKVDARQVSKEFTRKNEDNKLEIYLDSEGFPTISIGLNLMHSDNRQLLEKYLGRSLTKEENDVLSKKYSGATDNEKNNLIKATKNIKLTENQSLQLYEELYTKYETRAKNQFAVGKWCEDAKTKVKYYDPKQKDLETWEKLDPVAKGICVDLTYNAGIATYKNFICALKRGDYKHAAYELVDSQDGRWGGNFDDRKGKEENGVQKRRRDAAKDLLKLDAEKRKSP